MPEISSTSRLGVLVPYYEEDLSYLTILSFVIYTALAVIRTCAGNLKYEQAWCAGSLLRGGPQHLDHPLLCDLHCLGRLPHLCQKSQVRTGWMCWVLITSKDVCSAFPANLLRFQLRRCAQIVPSATTSQEAPVNHACAAIPEGT